MLYRLSYRPDTLVYTYLHDNVPRESGLNNLTECSVDGQQLMENARKIKTQDEITLLSTACMMADAAYEELYRLRQADYEHTLLSSPYCGSEYAYT